MTEKINIYTNLIISPKAGKIELKKYFNSIKNTIHLIENNFASKWLLLKDENYIDDDTFFIIEDVICLKTIYYKDDKNNLVYYGKLFIGLTDEFITILKVEIHDIVVQADFNLLYSSQEKVETIYLFIKHFHDHVLMKNKYYEDFKYKYEFGGTSDENFFKDDIRDERTVKKFSKHDQKTYFLTKGNITNINDKKLVFYMPNNISLSLSLAKKSYLKAKKSYYKLLQGRNEKIIKLETKDKAILYEYFEEVTTSIIFAYIAIEAFTNAAIPENFEYEKINDKKVKEIWSKDNIERWLSTSQKVSDILPKIFKTSKIKEEKFWQFFKELEVLRNDIIHQKTIENGTKLNSGIYVDLLSQDVFKKIKSAILVIKFFYDYDNSHPYFPLGLGVAKPHINEIDNINDMITKEVD